MNFFRHSFFRFGMFCCEVVNQFYDAEIIKEYVIRGNAAVVKCSIPSFVADFVYVESWVDEEGTIYEHSNSYGVCKTIHMMIVHCFFKDSFFQVENTEGWIFPWTIFRKSFPE